MHAQSNRRLQLAAQHAYCTSTISTRSRPHLRPSKAWLYEQPLVLQNGSIFRLTYDIRTCAIATDKVIITTSGSVHPLRAATSLYKRRYAKNQSSEEQFVLCTSTTHRPTLTNATTTHALQEWTQKGPCKPQHSGIRILLRSLAQLSHEFTSHVGARHGGQPDRNALINLKTRETDVLLSVQGPCFWQ
jgi:hypothetical protein